MTELLNDPALTPSLIAFLVGVVFTSIFAAIKGKISRSVALAKEKVTEEGLKLAWDLFVEKQSVNKNAGNRSKIKDSGETDITICFAASRSIDWYSFHPERTI